MKNLILVTLFLSACGVGVSDSDHEVHVSGETVHTVQILIGDCEKYEGEKADECNLRYANFLEALGNLNQAQAEFQALVNELEAEEQ